jgi:hypothetical protein
VVEEQVDIEIPITYLKVILAAHESKAHSELEQEVTEVVD